MDYPVQLANQLQQLLKSLRKSHQMTQAELARRLGVVQSRVADIERDPGAVRVDQLLQVLAMLGAQVVIRHTGHGLPAVNPTTDLKAHAPTTTSTGSLTAGTKADAPTPGASPDSQLDDEPRGQW